MLTQMVGPALIVSPFVIGNIPELSGDIIFLTLCSGLGSMIGNVLMLFAYRMQEASKLAPFVYFQLITAVFLGWLFFTDLPDALSFLGMGVIIFAGSTVAILQARSSKSARPSTARA